MPAARQTRRSNAPATASSRRRPQPQVEQDEEEPAPNNDEEDDDDNDDEAVPQGVIKHKKFSAADFIEQALDVGSEKQLKGYASSWSTLPAQIKSDGFSMISDTARVVEDAGGDDELISQLDGAMRDLIDVHKEICFHTKTLDDLRQKLLRREEIDKILEQYETGYKEKLDDYSSKTGRQKYGKDDNYVQLRNSIWDGAHGDTGMPPDFIIESLPREKADEGEDSDDDIVLGGQTQDFRCPITLGFLVDAVTSKICHHSYSRDGIADYLKSGPQECPATGCDKMISKADLEEDKKLAKEAQRAQRKEQEREEDLEDDAEEVDED